MIFKDLKVEQNPDVIKVNISMVNDGVHSTVLNFTVQTFKTLNMAKSYLKISVPTDDSDKSYNRQIINTVFDVEKVLNGISSNMLIKSLSESLFKSIDVIPKFPFQPVSFLRPHHHLRNKFKSFRQLTDLGI